MRPPDALKNLPDLETGRLLLRGLRPEDAEALFGYASDPEVARYVTWDAHRTVEDSRAFLRAAAADRESGEEPGWGIVYKAEGKLIGTCGLINYSAEHARVELGYALSRDYWGRGIMTEAVRAVISFSFQNLSLNRIEARCFAENTASARVMEKAGMTYEDTLRQREFRKSSYRDMKVYSILRDEFTAL